MKIAGILVAYDEHPSWIATAVSGFARVCNDIVYVDGSYALYPQAKPRSHAMESEAVLQACDAAGVGCLVYRPRDVWLGNEVEKRNHSLRLAATLDPDWVCVFDADHHVTHCHPELVRADLEATDLNVASYVRIETDGETKWHERTRLLYRWTDDLAYGPAHYTVSGTYGGKKHWLRGAEHMPGDVSTNASACLDLDSLVCVHRTGDRLSERRDAMARYSQVRDAYDVEKVSSEMFERALA